MKFVYLLLGVTVAFMLDTLAVPVQADDVQVDAPGVHISTNGNSTSVDAPGTQVRTGEEPGFAISPPMAGPAQTTVATPSRSYSNADLTGMDFNHQALNGALFSNSNLTGANFRGAVLKGADFSNAKLDNADFTDADLTGANLSNSSLVNANLTNADFSKTNLTNASLDHAIAANTRFNGAILSNANMSTLIRTAAPQRPAFVDAGTISAALKTDPSHPSLPRKIDLTVNFDFNSDKLTADGGKQVREIAGALQNASLQHARIRIEGHTDSVGSDSYNQALSYRRALRVLQTLTNDYGIPARGLSAKGFGKTEPIASNDSDLGRAMNRRVTLVNLGN